MALSTETSHQHLVVLLDVVQATVVGHEGGDLLAVLDQLHTHALANSRVGLFGFDANLLENDALSVGSTTERVGLPAGAYTMEIRLLKQFINKIAKNKSKTYQDEPSCSPCRAIAAHGDGRDAFGRCAIPLAYLKG